MPVRKPRSLTRAAVVALAMLGLGIAAAPPVSAQSRTLAGLADVPALVPAPYHAQSAGASYSAALYTDGVYQGAGAHYWH